MTIGGRMARMSAYRRILVAVDGSAATRRAARSDPAGESPGVRSCASCMW